MDLRLLDSPQVYASQGLPETGLEPALPLRQPGPQGSVSASLSIVTRVAFMLHFLFWLYIPAILGFTDIVVALMPYGMDCRKIAVQPWHTH
jgi:hypothetical protein